MNSTHLFGLGDGDRVQAMIDNALLDGDLDRVKHLSEALTATMTRMADLLQGIEGWHVVFFGGDDICITVERTAYRAIIIEGLMREFNEMTGGTISFGVGTSIESAYINLRRAKSRGSGLVVATTDAV